MGMATGRRGGGRSVRGALARFVAVAAAAVFAAPLCSCAQPASTAASDFDASRAMEHVRAQVAFGPRPPGSPALEACRGYIAGRLREFGYEVEEDAFVAETPYGQVPMKNLIARRRTGGGGPGVDGKPVVVLATHYDTKLMPNLGEGKAFVGANDGGSGTGLLLELARVLAGDVSRDHWFLFLDGEEAFVEWSSFDSTYGSRHLARKWKGDGTAARIRAFVLLDMVGDRDLGIFYETHSTKRLMDLVWETATQAGVQAILSRARGPVEDDHIPFLDAGVPAVDIIDLDYGPGNSYHHTAEDTLDKVSAESLGKVGRLVLALLPRL
jgi:hypothetical protein